jgi:uncharacterized protein YndB with AHSA1/START domain
MNTTLRFDRVYPHPPARVWRALTEPALLARWLMPNDFEPRIGHRFTFRTKPAPGFDGIVHCEVLTLERERTLAISWAGGNMTSVVTFTLEPVPDGTRLRLEHAGFKGIREFFISRMLGAGWTRMLHGRLPALLDGLNAEQPAPPTVDVGLVGTSATMSETDLHCMTPRQRLLARLASFVPGHRR